MSNFFFYLRNGSPSARFVLMKGIVEEGLTFFTNYGSRKAKEIVEYNSQNLQLTRLICNVLLLIGK